MTPHRLALVAGVALLVFSYAALAAEDTGAFRPSRTLRVAKTESLATQPR